MAIQFARCEYVSRNSGGNACRKASYNQRDTLRCERTGEVFSFKERGGNVHHEILLPLGVDSRFQKCSVLWNEAERCERRKDSQVAKEFVIALPDDEKVSFEDRLELSRRFAQIFIEKGVGVQLDIHEPHDGEKNWHTHFLVTTRRFSEDGQAFFSKKATDLDPVCRKGFVVEGDLWGEIWRDLQNAYFEERGYDLRVDPIGVVAQEHLGPVRMRHHMNEALLRSQMLQKANEKLSQDPSTVIETLTQTRAVFTSKDVEVFLNKHVPFQEREGLLKKVLSHTAVIPLYDQERGHETGYFTTHEVRAEEEKLIRFADRIAGKSRRGLDRAVAMMEEKVLAQGIGLSVEQRAAYDHCVNVDQNLCLLQGRAGVGKSTVLNPIRVAHEEKGFRVLGLAPTHKVAMDLKEDGFNDAKTCHAFLFAFKNGRETLNSNTLVVVDEAGMLGTELSVELFHAIKKAGAKLILVGDDRQLSSVARGGIFGYLAERYGAIELKEVRRQTIDWQKSLSEDLSQGNVRSAVHLLQENNSIHWKKTKEEALADLLKDWGKEFLSDPQGTRLMLAQRNMDVDILNQGARDLLRERGRLGSLEVTCITQRGKMNFAEGDRIQFTKTDKTQDLFNSHFGVVQKIDVQTKKLSILLDGGQVKEVDPATYDGLRHGYASTVYKGQGSTLNHVYVLHSKVVNKSVNYVALTRQTRSLSLYVSQDETPSEFHLIRQMSRDEGNKISLSFATPKDIEKRQSEITLATSLKQGAENLVTKVKDFFHTNEDFYKFDQLKENPPHEVSLSFSKNPALQSVYEDMKQPPFAHSHAKVNAVRTAFEKGLKEYGETRAIAYWEGKKEGLFRLYQEQLMHVEKELTSPALNTFTSQWKEEARELAKGDPTKVLTLLQKLKADHLSRRETSLEEKFHSEEKIGDEMKNSVDSPLKEPYLRFKALQSLLKNNPKEKEYFKEELKRLGQQLAQDKDFMTTLQHENPKAAKLIDHLLEEERSQSLNLGKGGYSR